MKIQKVGFVAGEALFVVEGFPDRTFCVDLKGKTSQKQVTDELLAMLPVPDTTEDTFKDLKLKALEGCDL